MKFDKFMDRLKGFYRDESGITGLETAIILIAFIVVAAVFAFTIMTTGLFSTEKAKTTAQAGISQAGSTFAPKGGVIAQSVGANVTVIRFQITLAAGAGDTSVALARLAFVYTDDNQTHSTAGTPISATGTIIQAIAITPIVGVADDLLSLGDVTEIAVTLATDDTPLTADTKFRIEIIPAAGASMIIERRTPIALKTVMNLE
jgi:flagellin FlaB